jgi:transposase
MSKKYTAEERDEALKLAGEIGNRQASERLGINIDTIYTWISKFKQRREHVSAVFEEKGPVGLVAENERLRLELRQSRDEVEILQEALSFFVKRRKK